MADIKPEERFSIEDASHDGKAVLQKGGTVVDEREMTRMGKKQELQVRIPCDIMQSSLTSSAEFQIHRHRQLCHHFAVHVGMYPARTMVRAVQWRHCWSNLVHNRGLDMHDGADSIDGRDGFNGSDSWWTVPLGIHHATTAMSLADGLQGLRIRPSTLPEESLIHCWLVHLPWLDSWNTVLRTAARRHRPGSRRACLSARRSGGSLENDSDGVLVRRAHSRFQHVLRSAPALGRGNHPILAHFWILRVPSDPVDYG
jgi:hypothetical protein